MLWLVLMVGCRCGSIEPLPEVRQGSSHFGRFHGLVNAALEGDVEGARWIAQTLQEGDVPDPADDGGGAEKVGGALGFVQMAEDGEEVLDGLAAAAVGCGQCHAAAGVEKPPMGLWSHQSAGLRLVLGEVFPPAESPPAEGPELAVVRAAWDAAEGDEERLAAALAACVECHKGE